MTDLSDPLVLATIALVLITAVTAAFTGAQRRTSKRLAVFGKSLAELAL